MDIPLVGLPITAISCNYAGHENLHDDVNNLSPSREFDIEANKMTLIDKQVYIICLYNKTSSYASAAGGAGLRDRHTLDSCPAVLSVASGLQLINLVLTSLTDIPLLFSNDMSY